MERYPARAAAGEGALTVEDEGEATERCGEDAVTDRTGDFDATGLQGETARRRDAKTTYGHDLFPSNTHNLVFYSLSSGT